ncbi:hypothetical protein CDAR_304631 [Caerostris darwini]|uniref:Uncharacterized protein n=1 Tax=Caerostris darwini TaxID=1538125 RepID=A0AAV4NMC9_9ARAC|nr:hypothetical protein CDAR_304631 [Caerostris darwini]
MFERVLLTPARPLTPGRLRRTLNRGTKVVNKRHRCCCVRLFTTLNEVSKYFVGVGTLHPIIENGFQLGRESLVSSAAAINDVPSPPLAGQKGTPLELHYEVLTESSTNGPLTRKASSGIINNQPGLTEANEFHSSKYIYKLK